MKTFFGRDALENQKLTMGTVVFPPGARVPAQGAGVHEEHEYSYIISGSILTMSGGQEYRISEGQATLFRQVKNTGPIMMVLKTVRLFGYWPNHKEY